MSLARRMQQAAAGSAGAGPEPSGWTDPDLDNASYDSVSFSVAGQALLPTSFYISPDGLSLYVLDDGTNTAYQYSLSTAWDISSASYASKSFSSFSETSPTGIYFSSDGTKLYVTGFVSDAVSESNLSTPWDISTASLSQSFSIFSQTSLPTGVFFSPDGTKMFVSDTSADSIFKYVLSSAWDVSTASFSQSLSVTSEETNPQDIFLSPTGTKMFITGQNGVVIDEYSLSTAWDLSTATYSTSFSTSSQESNLRGAFFKVDGSKMYVVGVNNDTIYQYSTVTPAAPSWTDPDLANASYDSVSFSVAGQDTSPQSVLLSADGFKMYAMGFANDTLFQYSLSTAFDLSTASYDSVSLSVGAQEGSPYAFRFSATGSKLYIVGGSSDKVHQYSLSTAFDLSTASYDSVSFSVGGQNTLPFDLFFNPDGTKMYILGLSGDTVYQYTLSTGFDVSTASYDNVSFSVTSQEGSPLGFYFNPNGTKMFVIGIASDSVHQYSLSTAFDLSTASYDSVSFSVAAQDDNPRSVDFKPDGSKMYIVGTSTRNVYQYSTD